MIQSTQCVAARRGHPCPVCGAERRCWRQEDGLHFCRAAYQARDKWHYIGTAAKDPSWLMWRLADDPMLRARSAGTAAPQPMPGTGEGSPRKFPSARLREEALSYRQSLTPDRLAALATHLGLPVWCFAAAPLLGWRRHSHYGACWTSPEFSGAGEIIGITMRRQDGQKRHPKGHHRGITLPRDWLGTEGPTYIVEGFSDVMAMVALGLIALGTYTAGGGAGMLAELAVQCTPPREYIVLGERDGKEDGSWPGRTGAIKLATELAGLLGRAVSWSLVPEGAKDIRAWCRSVVGVGEDQSAWAACGARLPELLQLHRIEPGGVASQGEGLSLRCVAEIQPEVMRWTVPGYLPEGELVLLAGEGGEGKSFVTCHLAAALSRGTPCFGLNHPPRPPCHVLIANCEDDSSRTIKPRLWAAGADQRYVHLVEGARLKDGSVAPFSMSHIEQLHNQLKQLANVGLVVIDPVSAYMGDTGVDSGRDDQIRTLLEPLRLIVREYRLVLCLIKHFNKSSSPKARHRIADAAGWLNACRACFLVGPVPRDARRKLLACEKMNGAMFPASQTFLIDGPLQPVSQLIRQSLPAAWPEEDRGLFLQQLALAQGWEESDLDTSDMVAEEPVDVRQVSDETEKAVSWLKRYLQAGPCAAASCVSSGNDDCDLQRALKWWRDKVLKARLGGWTEKARSFSGGWFWGLKGQTLSPTSAQESHLSQETQESQQSQVSRPLGE